MILSLTVRDSCILFVIMSGFNKESDKRKKTYYLTEPCRGKMTFLLARVTLFG